jgi:hypothetical protein
VVAVPDEFSITWSLFAELEQVEEDGRDLPDPEVDALVAGAESTIGTEGLLSGWALVAAWLRARLIEHAQTVGCDCGSQNWLRREQIRHADEGKNP